MQPRLFAVSFGLLFVYMTLWFLIAKKRKRLDTVDAAWGGGFALVAWWVASQEPALRTLMVAVLVTIWSARLTLHIAQRNRRNKEDARYVDMSKEWKRPWLQAYFSIFLIQGILIGLISVPIVFNANPPIPQLRLLFTLGYVIWVLGFFIEYRSDNQLAEFKAVKANKGKVLDTGMWKYSRHPNYFGEIIQWWGIGIIACQTSYGWFGLVGPVLLTILLLFVSGVPVSEARREGDKAYEDYKKRTRALIPLPVKK